MTLTSLTCCACSTRSAGGDIDIIRKRVELVLKALIEADVTEVIGGARYERSARRKSHSDSRRHPIFNNDRDILLA